MKLLKMDEILLFKLLINFSNYINNNIKFILLFYIYYKII